jgi:hypothetical protein
MPKHHQTIAKWIAPMALLALVFVAGVQLPGWLYMWAIAAMLFLSAKWITIFPLLVSARAIPRRRAFYYFLFRTGLNTDQFIFGHEPTKRCRIWAFAITKTLVGFVLIFLRKLFWVYYSLIGLCLIGFGTISVTLAPSGSPLARGLCGFLALFWTFRLAVAVFVLDVRPFLINTPRRIGYHLLNITFIALPIIYLLAAL